MLDDSSSLILELRSRVAHLEVSAAARQEEEKKQEDDRKVLEEEWAEQLAEAEMGFRSELHLLEEEVEVRYRIERELRGLVEELQQHLASSSTAPPPPPPTAPTAPTTTTAEVVVEELRNQCRAYRIELEVYRQQSQQREEALALQLQQQEEDKIQLTNKLNNEKNELLASNTHLQQTLTASGVELRKVRAENNSHRKRFMQAEAELETKKAALEALVKTFGT